MRLYTLLVAALLIKEGEQGEIGMHQCLMLLDDDRADAQAAGMMFARDTFPATDGWDDHYASAMEITQEFALDSRRLRWEVVV